MVVDRMDLAALHPFAILSLILSAAAVLGVAILAFRGSLASRDLHSFVSGALEHARQQVEQANPTAVRGLLEEFEHAIVLRVQKTERGFVALGEEVTDALDTAQRLDKSASAKRSRARQLEKKRDEREEEDEQAPGNYWTNPNLSRDQKLDLARQNLASRGIST